MAQPPTTTSSSANSELPVTNETVSGRTAGSLDSEPILPESRPAELDPSTSWNSVESMLLPTEEHEDDADISSSGKQLYGKENLSEDAPLQRQEVDTKRSSVRKFFGFFGPGCLIAVSL